VRANACEERGVLVAVSDKPVMNKLDQATGHCLETIRDGCARLLFALQQSPEAVWGEIMAMEASCHAFAEACARLEDKSASWELMTLMEDLRVQMARHGLLDAEEFAAFRKSVSALQSCVNRLQESLGGKVPGPGAGRRLKTCVFYCSNNLDAQRMAHLGEMAGGDTIKAIGLPCSGKVDVPYLIKALETGADAVAILACRKKECRHFEGSLRAHKRAEAVEALLKEIGASPGRIAVIECAQGGASQASEQIKQFIEHVKTLPQGHLTHNAMNHQERIVA
jgi:F420-non-reducing hydrogenase iron-sulfur subunit